jgi:hypothetical protein
MTATKRTRQTNVLMQLFDQNWKDHLLHLDHLRQGIGLRAYGQRDPAFDPADADGGGVATLHRPRARRGAVNLNDPATWGRDARNSLLVRFRQEIQALPEAGFDPLYFNDLTQPGSLNIVRRLPGSG